MDVEIDVKCLIGRGRCQKSNVVYLCGIFLRNKLTQIVLKLSVDDGAKSFGTDDPSS